MEVLFRAVVLYCFICWSNTLIGFLYCFRLEYNYCTFQWMWLSILLCKYAIHTSIHKCVLVSILLALFNIQYDLFLKMIWETLVALCKMLSPKFSHQVQRAFKVIETWDNMSTAAQWRLSHWPAFIKMVCEEMHSHETFIRHICY